MDLIIEKLLRKVARNGGSAAYSSSIESHEKGRFVLQGM